MYGCMFHCKDVVYHILFNQSSVEGLSGCFHFLASKNVTMKIYILVIVRCLQFSLDLGMALLGPNTLKKCQIAFQIVYTML